MPAKKLAQALSAVNWNNNVEVFLQDSASVGRIANANLRLATWARQFEIVDKGNPALCFIREMQVAGHNVAALSGLALYKPAAAAIRAILDAALYYSYFRTHLSELATLARDPAFFISKADILDYHKQHTAEFADLQQRLGLVAGINTRYRFLSAIVHGQIPGAWAEHKSLLDVKYSKPTLEIVVDSFCQGDESAHKLFLCTVGRELWDSFSTPAKKHLISGLHGDLKAALGIDSA